MTTQFSDYIVYVDESGDHGLQSLDPNYPVFVLAFCIFHKRYYAETVVPRLQKFKFQHFGHDLVILHEHEIRKEKGDFACFRNREHKNDFLHELTTIIEESNFVLASCVIEKQRLREQSQAPENPYHLALGFCLETLDAFLKEKKQQDRLTHVVVEKRGKKEDDKLELEFRRICDGENRLKQTMPFAVRFADKKANSAGLQLADLVARPIGVHVLRPEQANRAFDLLKLKFYCSGGRQQVGNGYEAWGLKRFPEAIKSEKPR
ncbi:hypothetical protein HNR62_001126 [Oceanisphaera litoralis]|uniref:DUF3800 domain-containing protein n=1 Tax=Oceanisphaera litoralis TaxID=225144 RepID=UPI00195DD91F|nr:DUF3800 domain-containing protein [Oceanisphaera litoralis]MBM7455266.1 hypothetical protein [Oceanisphaera litoralis]